MSKSAQSVALGQEVFVIERGGVVRTMIGKITKDDYTLLNGDCPEHWFSFDEARSELDKRLVEKQKELRATLRRMAKKRSAVWSVAYKEAVLAAPYKTVDLRDDSVSRARARKRVCPPSDFLLPGTRVFVPVTRHTKLSWSGADCYRPSLYFVLETLILSVCFLPDSSVHYSYSTPFIVEEMFVSKGEAETRLRDLVGIDGEEDIYFVPHREEKEYLESLHSEPPF